MRRGYCTKSKQEWPGSGSTLKNVFVIFTKLVPRRIFFCIAKILVLMVHLVPWNLSMGRSPFGNLRTKSGHNQAKPGQYQDQIKACVAPGPPPHTGAHSLKVVNFDCFFRARQRSGEGVVRRNGCPKGCFWRVRFFSAPLRFSGPFTCFKRKP